MRDNYVVVFRRRSSDIDIIGIIVGELDGKVRIEHPYYIKYDPAAGNIMMLIYCALTDESYFEFNKSDIEFLVTASSDVASKFLTMINTIAAKRDMEHDTSFDSREIDHQIQLIAGNNTKH